jgi:hypothetical protein
MNATTQLYGTPTLVETDNADEIRQTIVAFGDNDALMA